MERARRLAVAAAVALVMPATARADDTQSTLRPHSHAARDIADLWWALLIGSAVIVFVVTLLVVIAALRSLTRRCEAAPEDSTRVKSLVFAGGFAVPILVLATLLVLTLRTLPATSAPRGDTDLTVRVIGRQWFWDVVYPGRNVKTANEIHIPVGATVKLEARTDDVVHSFWVPQLNRKIDMIPGRTNSIVLRADRAGSYRGQCAEFCGYQHANMAFLVVAEPRAKFDAWLARESKPAPKPSGAEQRKGLQTFMSVGCSGCHAIAGTPADATVGPDLTHLASRETLAANTIPNTKGYLAGWILDPQHVKPGNRMPGLQLTGPQLDGLLAYLETLR
jgi:cytochrome c oxidase subunit II